MYIYKNLRFGIANMKLEQTCSNKMSIFSKLLWPTFCCEKIQFFIFTNCFPYVSETIRCPENFTFQKSHECLTIFLLRPTCYNEFLKQCFDLNLGKFVISF